MSYRIFLTTASVAAMLTAAAPAQATIFHNGDGSIVGSLCIGIDCTASESFGFDTLRFKENNLRIKFEDTSSSGSFPSRDWQLTANDSSNGGAEYFGIDDITAGTTVFRVYGGAPNNSLVVSQAGNVGIGTATPVVNLEIKGGNSPSLRLQQDGSSGFTPQTWDVAGNETNFFVRDVTNSSALPFRIMPGSNGDALIIASTGNVSIGAGTSPTVPLHVQEGDSTAGNQTLLLLENSGGRPRLQLTGAGSTTQTGDWSISAGDTFVLQDRVSSTNVMIVDTAGNMTITGGLISTGGGGACTVADPCDAVFDPSVYTVPSIEEHAALMWENKHLPAVGPTGADTPINMTTTMLRMLNELEHAHIYIEQLNSQMLAQNEEIAELKTLIAAE